MLKTKIKSFEEALREPVEAGDPKSVTDESFEGALYVPESDEKAPGWASFLRQSFPDLELPESQTASALLFIKRKKRIFALAFGHGRHLLDPDAYERDFGLRVVVNRVHPERIRGVSLRVFKEMAVKRQEEAAKGTQLSTFGVDIRQDLLRAVTGVPDDKDFAARVSGADSLMLDVRLTFADLGEKCDELAKAYSEKAYQQRGFSWIDNLRLVTSPSVVESLDKKLLKALKDEDEDVQLVGPDGWSWDSIQGFYYSGEGIDGEPHLELSIHDWYDAVDGQLDDLTVENLRKRRIRAAPSDGGVPIEAPEYDCFVFETELRKGTKYVLSNGQWFEVALSFHSVIDDYIKKISRNAIHLPNAQSHWKEDDYVTEAVAANTDLLSMHTNTCHVGGTAIEVCDLLSKNGQLVHLKIWTASATFSHLLAQGAVSAEILLRELQLRQHVCGCLPAGWNATLAMFPNNGFVSSQVEVVLGLIRKLDGPLPFFSRLNLLREGERIERLGYKLAYQRIPVV